MEEVGPGCKEAGDGKPCGRRESVNWRELEQNGGIRGIGGNRTIQLVAGS